MEGCDPLDAPGFRKDFAAAAAAAAAADGFLGDWGTTSEGTEGVVEGGLAL